MLGLPYFKNHSGVFERPSVLLYPVTLSGKDSPLQELKDKGIVFKFSTGYTSIMLKAGQRVFCLAHWGDFQHQ